MLGTEYDVEIKICVIQEASSRAIVRNYVSKNDAIKPYSEWDTPLAGVEFYSSIYCLGDKKIKLMFFAHHDDNSFLPSYFSPKLFDAIILIPYGYSDMYINLKWVESYIKAIGKFKFPIVIMPNSVYIERDELPISNLHMVPRFEHKAIAPVLITPELVNLHDYPAVNKAFAGIVNNLVIHKFPKFASGEKEMDLIEISSWSRRKHAISLRKKAHEYQTVRFVPSTEPHPIAPARSTSFYDCLCQSFSCLVPSPSTRTVDGAEYRELGS
jgi:hypothetical protein